MVEALVAQWQAFIADPMHQAAFWVFVGLGIWVVIILPFAWMGSRRVEGDGERYPPPPKSSTSPPTPNPNAEFLVKVFAESDFIEFQIATDRASLGTITVAHDSDKDVFEHLLDIVREESLALYFHDPLYVPNSTTTAHCDQGAYFRYAPLDNDEEIWEMGLAYDDWSGSGYRIATKTLLRQLYSLNAQSELRDIQVGPTSACGPMKSNADCERMERDLRTYHGDIDDSVQ